MRARVQCYYDVVISVLNDSLLIIKACYSIDGDFPPSIISIRNVPPIFCYHAAAGFMFPVLFLVSTCTYMR